jgi:hypothetical protein
MISIGKDFLSRTPAGQRLRMGRQMGLHEIKKLLDNKEIVSKLKRSPTE